MSLNSSYLDAFFACAQLKSFTRAAARLHITQSALSQRIKNLEEDLSATLIIRERAGLRLTEKGEEILRYCQTKEDLEAEAVSRIRDSGSGALGGSVRIGTFSSVGRSVVMPALAPLLRENPELQLKLAIHEIHELPPLLKSGAIDFLITLDELKQEGLASQPLGHEKSVLVRRRGTRDSEAANLTYLDHDEEDLTTARYLRKKSASGLRRRYLGDSYGILEGARLGLGRAVVPVHLAAKYRDLEIIDPARVLSVPITLHYYEQPFFSKLHQTVVTALTRECPRILAT